MKIAKLQGGLGNQMFQYAIARALETDKKKNIYIDLSFLEQHNVSTEYFTSRDYELHIFNDIRAKVLNKIQKKILLSDRVRYTILRKIFRTKLTKINQIENEFVDFPKSATNIYLNGYFQSEKYFQSIRKDLIQDFKFPDLDIKNKDLQSEILKNNSVSIHIRRGDYINLKNVNSYYEVLGLEYYKEAISQLEKKVSEPLHYYIFSDDPDYAREALSFLQNMQVICWNTNENSWKDMALMQACKHHIIANSSFSWWGAWLSERDGIKLAPANWFKENVLYSISDIIPDRWIKL